MFCGLVMAAGTLGVLSWASGAFGDVVARTMGVTTFALFRLFSSLETADEDESLFSGSILSNRPLLIGTGLSVLTIIFATELGFLQRILGMVSLTADQWAVCLLVACRSSSSRRSESCCTSRRSRPLSLPGRGCRPRLLPEETDDRPTRAGGRAGPGRVIAWPPGAAPAA